MKKFSPISKHLTNNLPIVICCILFLILGFLCGGVFSQWDFIKNTFFNIRMIEIIQILTVIIIGCYFAYIINIRFRKELRKTDILFDYLKLLQEKVVITFSKGHEFMKDHSTVERLFLLSEMKTLSSQISTFESIISEMQLTNLTQIILDIKTNFFEFKSILTGGTFGGNHPSYSENDIAKYEQVYQRLMKTLFLAKMKIYS